MKFFKHGDALAIVLPEWLRARHQVRDGDEFEWVEVEDGVFALADKKKLAELAKHSVVAGLLKKALQAQGGATWAAGASESAGSAGGATELLEARSLARAHATAALQKLPAKQALSRQGFVVIQSESEAKALSAALEADIKAGLVRGVRGFDKKYYVVTKTFFDLLALKIRRLLEQRPLSASVIAESAKTSFEGALAVLYVLKEEGEVIEKKRGVFALVK